MRLMSIFEGSKQMMGVAVERVAENYKPAAIVFTYTFSTGFLATIDYFVGKLPTLCMLAGFIGSVILANSHRKKSAANGIETEIAKINLIRAQEERELANIKLRVAREELLSMKIEVRSDDKK